MEPLVNLDDFTEALPSAPDTATAVLALRRASGLVRAIGGQTITFVSQETVCLTGGDRVLTLPQRPVVVDGSNPLTIVELGDYGGIDLAAVEGRDYTRVGNELTRGFPWFDTTRLMGWPHNRVLGVWAPRVRATYSHGDLEVPPEVESIVLDVATSLVTNPAGLRSWTTPEYSETYATELLGAATVASIKQRLAGVGRGRRGAFSITPT